MQLCLWWKMASPPIQWGRLMMRGPWTRHCTWGRPWTWCPTTSSFRCGRRRQAGLAEVHPPEEEILKWIKGAYCSYHSEVVWNSILPWCSTLHVKEEVAHTPPLMPLSFLSKNYLHGVNTQKIRMSKIRSIFKTSKTFMLIRFSFLDGHFALISTGQCRSLSKQIRSF